MNKKLIISGSFFLFVAGLAWAALVMWPAYEAEQTVKTDLKDPDSAKFRQVKHFRETGGTCGLVNAKNSMGGYVGDVRFVVQKDGILTFGPKGNHDIGTTQEKLAVINDEIKFLTLLIEHCPEPVSSKP